MTMKQLLSLALVSLVLVSTSSFAEPRRHHHPRDPGVNARQHVQGERIRQGVRSGELTREEARSLMQERRNIRQEERAYKSDGHLTREERKDLHQDLNDLSRDIYHEKHDDEKRPRAQRR
jgi:Skp family chaperone for outer membrane proteins